MKASGSRRERGAYYTPETLASALATWAIRSKTDVVIDPAAGRGALLIAAIARLRELRSRPNSNVWAVELHRRTHKALCMCLAAEGIPVRNVLYGELFNVLHKLPRCSVVLANPPYVRHQEIPPRVQRRMRKGLYAMGASIDGKASSWAYFLGITPLLLSAGGRLAAVLPADVITSDYGVEVLDCLRHSFASVQLCYCDGTVFAGLSQRTVLCLADDFKGSRNSYGASLKFHVLKVCAHASIDQSLKASKGRTISPGHSLPRLLAPASVLQVERSLEKRTDIRQLGRLATIRIGYVTGDNQFFHLTHAAAASLKLGAKHLAMAVRREREVRGIRFTRFDWKATRRRGSTCLLLTPQRPLPEALRRLLRTAAAGKARSSSHCRKRAPWWAVPLDKSPPAFMIYMGNTTRIVSNVAQCQVSNSFFSLSSIKEGLSARDLAVASLTSAFQLSAFLNCRLLGGGLRKLEPSDAGLVLVPCAKVSSRVARRIDRLVREGRWDDAIDAADVAVLHKGLGWTNSLIGAVQTALRVLKDRVC